MTVAALLIDILGKYLCKIRKPIQISLNTTILYKIIRHFMTQDQILHTVIYINID